MLTHRRPCQTTRCRGPRNNTGLYRGGIVMKSVAANSKDGAFQSTVTTTNDYAWWNGAVSASVQVATDNVSGADTHYVSSYHYDDAGTLASVDVADGRPRSIWLRSDASGLFLERDEADANSGTGTTNGDPREMHFYLEGLAIGDVSNNGTSDTDYATGIARHTATPGSGPFLNGAASGTPYADFDQSYDPINGLTYDSAATRYTVQDGDTLEGIALKLWGDASYWYLIAERNGLMTSAALVAGQDLVIPNKVHNSHNNSDVFRVYDLNDIIGNTSPTNPKAPKKKSNNCGVFGQILMVAIAVAVTAVTAGGAAAAILPGSQGILGGLGAIATAGVAGTAGATLSVAAAIGVSAGAAALGSIVSQGFGIATGVKDNFSWKGVALSALAGGVTAGLGSTFGSGWTAAAARGAVGSVISQGIGVATGLQAKFDFANVAAAGVGAAIGGSIKLGGMEGRIVSGMAGGIAGAAAVSLVTGDDFGDTLMSSLPSIIGNTIGNLAAEKISSFGREDINSDLVKLSKEERAEIQGGRVRTVNIPASSLPDQNSEMIMNVSSHFGGELFSEGGFFVSRFKKDTLLVPVLSEGPEWFTDSALKASKSLSLDQVINGEFFTAPPGYQSGPSLGVDFSPYVGAIGRVVQDGKVLIEGRASPEWYYIAQYRDLATGGIRNVIGMGETPLNASVGFGGGAPLIVDGLKFGVGNIYSAGISGPSIGDPGNMSKYLLQRNNNNLGTFVTGNDAKDRSIGKTILAFNSNNGKMMTVVQNHGSSGGASLMHIRDRLFSSGYNNAIVFDGSSSSTLVWGGKVMSAPYDYKNATIPVGIGFKSRY